MTRSAPPPLRRLAGWWNSLPVVLRDAASASLLFGISLLPLGIEGLQLGELRRPVAWGPALLLVAAQTLPLALRHTGPREPGALRTDAGRRRAIASLARPRLSRSSICEPKRERRQLGSQDAGSAG